MLAFLIFRLETFHSFLYQVCSDFYELISPFLSWSFDIKIDIEAISLNDDFLFLFLYLCSLIFFITAREIFLLAVILIYLYIIFQSIFFKVIVSEKRFDYKSNVWTEAYSARDLEPLVYFSLDCLIYGKLFGFREIYHIVSHVHHKYIAETLQI